MVTLTIDNRPVTVPEGTTILDAAKTVDIHIPTLCYLREINEVAACRVCAVEVEGVDKLAAACNTQVEDGMVVRTNTQRVRLARKTNVELILSQHVDHCVTCVRSGNCSLQALSKAMNIQEVPFRNEATDACHENTFFQMEGIMVDKDISIANLIYFMKTMLCSPWACGRSPAPVPTLPSASRAACA